MNTSLHEKVALVTGASSGIGRATALLLQAEGATVAAAARSKEKLEDLEGMRAFPVDLSDPAHAEVLADDVERSMGRVDILVNNAGWKLDAAIEDTALEDLDSTFQTNTLSPFMLASKLLPGMKERGGGVIASVVAPAVSGGYKGMGAYAASKAALLSFSETLRQEAGPSVAVFAFDPGWVKTALAPDGPGNPKDAAQKLVGHIVSGKSSKETLS